MKDHVARSGCGALEDCTTQLVLDSAAFEDVAGNRVNRVDDGEAMPGEGES
jgi:hypothetical protein